MPRDVVDLVECPSIHVEEIAILDGMAALLRKPRYWCKEVLREERFWGRPSHCLMGALNVMDHGTHWHLRARSSDGHLVFSKPAAHIVELRMQNLTPDRDIASFNNAATTTHADILSLIATTKKTFE